MNKIGLSCHSSESWNPEIREETWIPIAIGMTENPLFTRLLLEGFDKGRVILLGLPPRSENSEQRKADDEDKHKTRKELPKCLIEKL